MIDAATRARWRRMFDARTAGPWAHEPGTEHVTSTVYHRKVCLVPHHEDADAIAQSYDGWPRTLDELERVEAERDEARNELEPMKARLKECNGHLLAKMQECAVFRDHTMSAGDKRAELDHENQLLTDERNALRARVADLERMLDAWRRHRNSPLLIADYDNYRKRHP